jgi:thioredoxin 1
MTFHYNQSNAFIINPSRFNNAPTIQRIQNPTRRDNIDVTIPSTELIFSSIISTTTRNSGVQLLMSVSSSKTGGRLIESAEEYFDIVMDDENQQRPVLVFWTAPWCGPCRLSIPVVKDIMKQFANKIDVFEVCTDDLPDVASDAGVVSIPTIHLYYRGKLLDTIIGCVAKTVLASSVDKALEDIALQNGGSLNDNKLNGEQ